MRLLRMPINRKEDVSGRRSAEQLKTRSLIHVCTDRGAHTHTHTPANAHRAQLKLMTKSITRIQCLLVILYAFLLQHGFNFPGY